jgi:hypothetical protein
MLQSEQSGLEICLSTSIQLGSHDRRWWADYLYFITRTQRMFPAPTPRRRLAYLISEQSTKNRLAVTFFLANTYSNAPKIVRISRAVGSKSGLLIEPS